MDGEGRRARRARVRAKTANRAIAPLRGHQTAKTQTRAPGRAFAPRQQRVSTVLLLELREFQFTDVRSHAAPHADARDGRERPRPTGRRDGARLKKGVGELSVHTKAKVESGEQTMRTCTHATGWARVHPRPRPHKSGRAKRTGKFVRGTASQYARR